jgi:hypothetical protein
MKCPNELYRSNSHSRFLEYLAFCTLCILCLLIIFQYKFTAVPKCKVLSEV